MGNILSCGMSIFHMCNITTIEQQSGRYAISPPISASVILHNASLSLESYAKQYANDDDFKEIYAKITHGSQVEN